MSIGSFLSAVQAFIQFTLQVMNTVFINGVKPKTLKMLSAVTLAKRSAIKCSAEDEMNRE